MSRRTVTPLVSNVGVAEMAKQFDRSPRWVRAQVKAGTFPIPHIEHSPVLVWKREDVDRWRAQTTYKRAS